MEIESAGSVHEAQQGELRTFLIADVRGYTRFTQERGDDAAARLAARFAALVREEVELGRGALLELRGDEALAVFDSPRRALGTAVALQARFARETAAEPEVPLGVGIGVDVGEAVAVEGGYRGGALNLAARLCSLAGPGEVLASRELVHLARKVPGLAYRERKPVRLKGFADPVAIVEVVAEGELAHRPAAVRRAEPRRRRAVLAGALVAVLAAGGTAAAVLLTRAPSALARIDFSGVGRIDPGSGRIVSELFPSTSAAQLTADGAGGLWTSNPADDTVSHVDSTQGTVVNTVPVGSSPSGLAAGAGFLWVADTLDGTVSRIDPQANKVVETVHVGHAPSAVAFADGAVWVANAGDRTLSKLDPRTGRLLATLSTGADGRGIAAAGGMLWVLDSSTDSVAELDARSGQVVRTVRVGTGPAAIVSAFGSVWVANAFDGTLSRIDPQRGVVAATVDVGGSPVAAAASDGRVWIADQFGRRLVAVDPATSRVVRTVAVGSPPLALAAGGGKLWLSVAASPASHRGGTLRLVSPPASFDTLDPALANEIDTVDVLTITNDGLVTFRHAGGSSGTELVPDLATSLPTPTDGGTTYTFQLRRGLRYSNGEPVAPADFRFALERDFRLGSPGARFYGGIVGADACARQPAHCDLSRGVVVDDATRTVTFQLAAPDPDFLDKLALWFADPLPARTTPLAPATRPLPATGPYRVAVWTAHAHVVLVRNPLFRVWSPAAQPAGYPDRIDWDATVPPDAETTAGERGRADAMLTLAPPPNRLAEVQTFYASQVHSHPYAGIIFVFLDTRVAPFDDVRVRRALNLALDRNAIVRMMGGPQVAQPTCQVLPPLIPGHHPYCPYTRGAGGGAWTAPDLARARALVATSGTRGDRVTLWAWSIEPYLAAMRYVVGVLHALGYRASLEVPPPAQYFPDIANPKLRIQGGLDAWIADYPAASDFLAQLRCAAPPQINFSRLCDPAFDRLAARAQQLGLTDPQAASSVWAQADRRAVDDAVYAPLFVPRAVDLLSRRTGGYQFSPQWGVLLDQLWVR